LCPRPHCIQLSWDDGFWNLAGSPAASLLPCLHHSLSCLAGQVTNKPVETEGPSTLTSSRRLHVQHRRWGDSHIPLLLYYHTRYPDIPLDNDAWQPAIVYDAHTWAGVRWRRTCHENVDVKTCGDQKRYEISHSPPWYLVSPDTHPTSVGGMRSHARGEGVDLGLGRSVSITGYWYWCCGTGKFRN